MYVLCTWKLARTWLANKRVFQAVRARARARPLPHELLVLGAFAGMPWVFYAVRESVSKSISELRHRADEVTGTTSHRWPDARRYP